MSAWPKAVTFDCYGTLVQWPETLRSVFDTLLPAGADHAAFDADFRALHVELKSGPYRPYSQILRLALEGAMRKRDLGNVQGAQDRLLGAVQAIPPYPDVIPVLRSIARTCRIAIISNTGDALIEKTVRGLEVPCEVVTAEQAHAYKPDRRLFAYAYERLGVAAEETVHVGAGYATDMVPAFELGIARVWINRRGERADPRMPPTAELPDLARLEATISTIAEDRYASTNRPRK